MVGIIIMLILVLLPVLNLARKNALKSHCISNLHQIGVALQLYREDYHGSLPQNLGRLLPYSKARDIFVCPVQRNTENSVLSLTEGVPTNYVTILRDMSDAAANINLDNPNVQAAKILMERDPNYGVVVCVLHGQPFAYNPARGPMLGSHEGLILRLQVDTSVKPIHVYSVRQGSRVFVPGWFVFSNVRPCPEEIVRLNPLMLDCPDSSR